MTYPNGSQSVLSRGSFAQLVQVRAVPCSDGKSRNTKPLGRTDTSFSVPAAVCVKGRTVTGFLTYTDDGYTFTANKFGTNGGLLPDWEA